MSVGGRGGGECVIVWECVGVIVCVKVGVCGCDCVGYSGSVWVWQP